VNRVPSIPTSSRKSNNAPSNLQNPNPQRKQGTVLGSALSLCKQSGASRPVSYHRCTGVLAHFR
jgi:hypothetical protein